ncbi:MAG TPA: isoprenylcysteine carboxylmethyltransferase family protein [Candidatus Binatia bacterium]|jgi:protein-S-isoprenylcysteine O-methyltransferase Ste14|nr:isoprenylcysteine carboxylmethyltransferase family protein [Candidatus Binatia bacterium]
MTSIALTGWVVFGALAFGLRSFLHWRQTGRTGFVGLSGRVGSVEWLGGVLFVVACVAGPGALLVRHRWDTLDVPAMHALGMTLFAFGLVGTLWAQLSMGASWRIGVDAAERTTLVTRGPFRWVRNPIFTAMLLAVTGLGLLVPNAMSAIAVVVMLVAVELQVRAVEEPYLVRSHGPDYRRWAAQTGRFLPGIGRLDATPGL